MYISYFYYYNIRLSFNLINIQFIMDSNNQRLKNKTGFTLNDNNLQYYKHSVLRIIL